MTLLRKSSLAIRFSALAVLAGFCLDQAQHLSADIQDPPLVRQGPVRKLSRGVANMTSGMTEIYSALDQVNDSEGNAAMFSYGIIRGITRTLTRFGVGVYEVVTFPFPTNRGSYGPVLKQPTPWVHGGYEEFPPELGFESRFDYCRTQNGSTRIP